MVTKGKQRMLQGTFGSITYQSGLIEAGHAEVLPGSLNPSFVGFNEGPGDYMGVKRHNDELYVTDVTPGTTTPHLRNNARFMSYEYVDLRDLLDRKTGIDDVIINIQRMYENPFPSSMVNPPPGGIEEHFIMVLGKLDLSSDIGSDPANFQKLGFVPSPDLPSITGGYGGLPFQVLYRETRRYYADPSQTYNSPGSAGTYAGLAGTAGTTPSRVVANLSLVDRTVGGYPDLLVGPGITVLRIWNVFTANRFSQVLQGDNPADTAALEYLDQLSRTNLSIPALQWNIIGTERSLTDTEEAVYYSNILLNASDD